MSANILIVEDESSIRQMIAFLLRQNGYQPLEAADAEQARRLIADESPSLILMDWMLPGTSGIELTRQLKQDSFTQQIPVVMLTARGEEDDKVRGLDCGAEDYITKPFSPRELVARIRAILRRVAPHVSDEVVDLAGLRLDPRAHRVSFQGQEIRLGPTEYRLLHFFLTHSDRVYRRSRLLDEIWGANAFIEERTVDVHIRRLRQALEPYGLDNLIQTVRGAGYRFSELAHD
jgi:two-component system, OmpR family, phosphate regulon response regulator PhoB